MAFNVQQLATRPATWLRPRRNQELTDSSYPDVSRLLEAMFTAITRLPWAELSPESFAAAKMEVSETEKEISVVAELPGVSQQDVEVSLDDDVLTIRAESRGERVPETDEQRHFSVTERGFGGILRALRLPFSPDPNQVEARLQNGLLTVRIAKPQSVQDKVARIPVHADTNAATGAAQTPNDGAETAASSQNQSARPSGAEASAH